MLAGASFAAAPTELKPVSEKDFALIAPVAAGELRLRPTFESCGVAWGAAAPIADLQLEYRRAGSSAWLPSRWPPPYFAGTRDYRASLTALAENTDYEVRLKAAGAVQAAGAFRTWRTNVPIARTETIDPATARFPIVLDARGTPDGWVRYVVKGGRLDNPTKEATLAIVGAEYVLLDGATLTGAYGGFKHEPIHIERSRGVRIRNCEVSHWGVEARPDWERGGQLPNWQSAIYIGKEASEVTVERSYVHDPVSYANSWRYSHPSGPEAVLVDAPAHSTVIRYCDFIGSDDHRYNDVIEGALNGSMTGGFNRDADVYGNFLAFANDDCIELDGGQQNVRCYDNRFEGALSGVSVQCANAGPGYVFDNLFCELGERFGCVNPAIKTAGIDLRAYGPPSYLCGNVFYGAGRGIETYAKLVRWTVESNVFAGVEQRLILPAGNRTDGNRLQVPMTESLLDPALPRRPLPFVLTKTLVKGVVTDGQTVTPAAVGLEAVHDGVGRELRFQVRQNEAFDWFEVSPAAGTIGRGERVTFTVRFRPERMRGRRHWRGAFLVRTPGGLSRPVTVYAENPDFVQPLEVQSEGAMAIVRLPKTELDAALATNAFEVTLEAPKAGRYHVLLYGHGTRRWPGDGGWKRDHVRIATAVNAGEALAVGLQADVEDAWMVATPGCGGFGGTKRRLELPAGKLTLRIYPKTGKLTLTGAALAEDPTAFEPR